MFDADPDRSRRRAGETADGMTFREGLLTVGTELFVLPFAVRNDIEVETCETWGGVTKWC